MLDDSMAAGAAYLVGDLPDRPVRIAAPAAMTKDDDRCLQGHPSERARVSFLSQRPEKVKLLLTDRGTPGTVDRINAATSRMCRR
jgi:hypothetical protein